MYLIFSMIWSDKITIRKDAVVLILINMFLIFGDSTLFFYSISQLKPLKTIYLMQFPVIIKRMFEFCMGRIEGFHAYFGIITTILSLIILLFFSDSGISEQTGGFVAIICWCIIQPSKKKNYKKLQSLPRMNNYFNSFIVFLLC
eukprot:UN02570